MTQYFIYSMLNQSLSLRYLYTIFPLGNANLVCTVSLLCQKIIVYGHVYIISSYIFMNLCCFCLILVLFWRVGGVHRSNTTAADFKPTSRWDRALPTVFLYSSLSVYPFSCLFLELLWILVLKVFKEQLYSFNPSWDSFWLPVALLNVNYVSLLQWENEV